jgi:hypothetical protein
MEAVVLMAALQFGGKGECSMKYVLINQKTICEVIPEINPVFPGFPIEERYSSEFLSMCVPAEDDVEVHPNWIYENGIFVVPPQPEFQEEDEEKDEVTE